MRKFGLAALAILMLVGCKKEQNDGSQALADYRAQAARLEALMDNPQTTDELFEATFEETIRFADSIFTVAPSDSLAMAILNDMVWYLDLDFRERLYAALDTNTMDEHMLRYYKAFQAEKLTAAGCSYVDFSALTPQGTEIRLSDVVGTKPYVLVDFWATWCGPCRASLPAWKELYAESSDRLQIVGVSLDADHDSWADYIRKNNLSWLHMSDLQGWDAAPAAIYGVCSIPATILIDANGTIVKRNVEPAELKALLNAAD